MPHALLHASKSLPPMVLIRLCPAWPCASTNPGMTSLRRASIALSARCLALTSAVEPTATIRSFSIATAPSWITRRSASIVTTTPFVMRMSAIDRILSLSSDGGGCLDDTVDARHQPQELLRVRVLGAIEKVLRRCKLHQLAVPKHGHPVAHLTHHRKV